MEISGIPMPKFIYRNDKQSEIITQNHIAKLQNDFTIWLTIRGIPSLKNNTIIIK